MNSSFLYHAWGLYAHECTREEYKGNTIILHIQTKEREKVCPRCGKRHLVKNGYRFRDFVGLPIGGKKVTQNIFPVDKKRAGKTMFPALMILVLSDFSACGNYTLISTSTPLGSSSFISASTVFAVEL